MSYLDFARLEAIDAGAFRGQRPYPWVNPEGLLTEAGYRHLRETMPELSLFEASFGKRRSHGQPSHDRYVLEYDDRVDVGAPWQEFLTELEGTRYRDFLRRLFAVGDIDLNFHWHYTPDGCAVSPHCDARHKLGSHIFYLNDEDDWEADWGGETLILDDRGRHPRGSAPGFDDFDRTIASRALGNFSLLFQRDGNSWHGVREIRCPEGHMRKVFIVVINARTPLARLRRVLKPIVQGVRAESAGDKE